MVFALEAHGEVLGGPWDPWALHERPRPPGNLKPQGNPQASPGARNIYTNLRSTALLYAAVCYREIVSIWSRTVGPGALVHWS